MTVDLPSLSMTSTTARSLPEEVPVHAPILRLGVRRFGATQFILSREALVAASACAPRGTSSHAKASAMRLAPINSRFMEYLITKVRY